jgi:hypothetical protein
LLRRFDAVAGTVLHHVKRSRRGKLIGFGQEDRRMSDFQRMVYASRATFAPSRPGGGIDLEVARILMQSRRNNPRSGLVGALYYDDSYFFQCLEGEAAAIDELSARIALDPRHTDMKVLGRHPIAARSFSVWAMKYVPNASEVQALLARHDLKQFDPYSFDETLVAAMVDLLRQGADADLLQNDASGSRLSGDRPPGPAQAAALAAAANSRRNLRWMLGVMTVAALAIAAFVLRR